MSSVSRLLEDLDLADLRCTVRRHGDFVIIDRSGMQAVVHDVGGGLLEVAYEHALHETTREQCSPDVAARFLRLIFSRVGLERIPVPEE